MTKTKSTQRTITSGSDGRQIPVTIDLKVQPLTHSYIDKSGKLIKNHPVVNGHGRILMNDEWIYVYVPNYGNISINVNRSNYCRKVYLMNTKVLDSITKPASPRLKKFIEKVADTLVFIHNGVSYRIFLKEENKQMEISHVQPYWATAGTGGIRCIGMGKFGDTSRSWHGGIPWGAECKKYGEKRGGQGGGWSVDLKETFGFEF